MILALPLAATLAAAASLTAASSVAHAAGDTAEGARVFRSCAVCHTTEEGGANKVGPNLWGMFGRDAGTRDTGFRYSQALSNAGITWTDDTMDQWVENPRQFIPGSRMPFPGLADAQAREDLIAFLREATQ